MSYLIMTADAIRIPLPDQSVDLVFGSPPYMDARTYGIAAQRDCWKWVDWMTEITAEALRVTRGCCIWVCAGVTRGRRYQPACEGLLWEGYKRGWGMESPCFWRRVGIPGSGGDQWFRKDVEYCLAFKSVAKLPWSDNTAMGKKPIFKAGGEMSSRLKNGRRLNDWAGSSNTNRRPDGARESRHRPCHAVYETEGLIANPGNLIDTGAAGGGNIGSAYAHENEAPFPEELAEWFIRGLCKSGGIVLDPFSGSGTTVSVADRLGRIGIGGDLRPSQGKLARDRIERPHRPVRKKEKPLPLFAGFEEGES